MQLAPSYIQILHYSVPVWIVLPVLFFLWVLILSLAKRLVFSYIKKIASKTETDLDDIFIQSVDFPLSLLIVSSGAGVVQNILPINGFGIANYLMIFKAITIFAIAIFADRFVCGLIQSYSNKVELLKTSGSIVHVFARVVVVCLGLLVLLDTFGVSVTPILASLGIGSLAVALALQPTLENFFSGVQLLTDKSIQLGQFVKLESGEEGYVHRIGWRSTWIRMPQNNIVVIPNKTLVNAKVINYYYPETELMVPINLGVHYESDLGEVEKVTIDVAKSVQNEVVGGIKDFIPAVRFHNFGDFSIDFTIALKAREFSDQALLKHEFVKRLHQRYKAEGIIIPYPVQAVNFAQERAVQDEEEIEYQKFQQSRVKKP